MRSLGWVLSLLAAVVVGAGMPICCLAEADCCAAATTADECAHACCDDCAAPREGIRAQPPAPHGLGCTCADLSLEPFGPVHTHSNVADAAPAIAPAAVTCLELPPPAMAATSRAPRCAPPRAASALRLPLLL
jgi:hypothetical protein